MFPSRRPSHTGKPRTYLRKHPHDAEIIRLAAPALGALVAEPIFLLADSAIVGHLGTPQLAALGIASTILTTFVGVSIFLAYGTTAAVARMIGANDLPGALRSGRDGSYLAIVIGGAVIAAGWPLAPWIIDQFGPAPEVAAHAETYLRISLLGAPSMLLVLAATGVLRGLQDTRTPLVVAATGAVGNVGLNYLLVYGFDMGVAGSAWGTVIAQTAMAATFIWVVGRASLRHHVSLRPSLSGMTWAFGTGIPLIIRTAAMRVALIVVTMVATGLGTAELAAHQIVFNTWMFLALVLDAVAIAAQALVGKALGSGNAAEARAVTQRMIQWGVLSGLALGVIIAAVGSVYARLFTSDDEVRTLIVAALIVAALVQPIAGWVFVLDGVLIGAGDGPYLAWASVIAVAVFLPFAWLVAALDPSGVPGIVALWATIGVWTIARVVTLALRERTGAWAVTGATR